MYHKAVLATLAAIVAAVSIVAGISAQDTSIQPRSSQEPITINPVVSNSVVEPVCCGTVDAVSANNQFAVDFYSKINDNEENIFFSPYSISTAFAIAYEGARGQTAEEIQSVFHFPADDGVRRSSFAAVQDKLNTENEDYELGVANALWVMDGFHLLQEYVDTAREYYDSEVATVNFGLDQARLTINEWVESKTNEKIKELIPEGATDKYTRLVITNAVYFKGTWIKQFDPEKTVEEDFKVNVDRTIRVPMMKLDESSFNYAETEELQVLELPYNGDKLSMLVMLPKDDDGLQSIEKTLSANKMAEWNNMLSKQSVIVSIPKFKLETNYEMNEYLTKMGMPSIFDPRKADLFGIDGEKDLYVSSALHKAFVDVNEEGTEAAAATAIIVTLTDSVQTPVPIFKADHPFIFVIQDTETGNILFMGRVADPTI